MTRKYLSLSASPTFKVANLMKAVPLRRLSTFLLPALGLLALAIVAGLLWLQPVDPALAQDDAKGPKITSGPTIASSPASEDTYRAGETITVTVTFSEAVTVTGKPRLKLQIGQRGRRAEYAGADESGTTLSFAYAVNDDDADTDGVSFKKNALDKNGGKITDADGNRARLRHGKVPNQAGHKVHGAPDEPLHPEPANSAPQFAGERATRSVAENTAAGASVADPVTAQDADGDTLTYSISGVFTIDGSGQITVKSALDYETQAEYTVTVTATDPDGATDSIEVTIAVVNVDEPGVVSIESEAGTPQAHSQLRATLLDPDGGVTGLTWTWERSTDGKKWELSRAGHRRSGTPGSGGGGGGGGGGRAGAAGAAGDTYIPPQRDVGKYLRATASYADGQDPGKTARSAATAAVMAEPPSSLQPHSDATDHATSASGFGLTISPTTIKESDFTGSATKTKTLTLSPTGSITVLEEVDYAYRDDIVLEEYTYTLVFAGDGDGGRGIFKKVGKFCVATAKGLNQFSLKGGPGGLAITDVRQSVDENGNCSHENGKVTLTLNGSLSQSSYTVTLSVTHEALSLQDGNASCYGAWNYDPAVCPESISSTFTLTGTDQVGPTISNLAITSSPASGQNDTYKTGDKIVATATFSEAVTATGTPKLIINVGGADKTANCAVKSGDATRLECSYTVAANDVDTDGIQVDAGQLTGTIADSSSNAAVLTYTATGRQDEHKVDGVAPAKPTGFTAAIGSPQVTLKWSDPGDASIAKWQYTDDGGASWQNIPGSSATLTEHAVTGLTAGRSYAFAVRAVDQATNVGPASDSQMVNVPRPCDDSSATPSGSSAGLVSDCNALLAAKDALLGTTTATLNWSADVAIGGWDGVTVRDEATSAWLSERYGVPFEAGRVTELNLANKGLNGTISVALGGLSALEWLDLSNNALTGPLPAAFAKLSKLYWLDLSDNNLTGGIPAEYVALTPYHLAEVTLTGNDLTGTVALTLTPHGGVSAGAISEGGGTQTVTVTAKLDPGSAWAQVYAPGGSPLTVTVQGSGADGAVDFTPVDDFSMDIDLFGWVQGEASADFDIVPLADSGIQTNETITVNATGTGAKGSTDLELTSNSPTLTLIDGTPANSNPRFSDGATAIRRVLENSATGVAVGNSLTAVDADGDTLTYTLAGEDAACFDIDTGTGQIKVQASPDVDMVRCERGPGAGYLGLDYEAVNNKWRYSVIVTVSDGKDAAGNADMVVDDTIAVTIEVIDVDIEGGVSFSSETPQVEESLSARLVDIDRDIRIDSIEVAKWERLDSANASSGTTIDSATADTYTPVAADVGKWLRVTFNYIDQPSLGKKEISSVTANAVVAAP